MFRIPFHATTAAILLYISAVQLRLISAAQDIAICVASKDDNLDIREWAEYHFKIGVSKIYLYDGGSYIPLKFHLIDYIDAGKIWYKYINDTTKSEEHQLIAYPHCSKTFGKKHDFMAFIDTDEFIFLHDPHISLPDFLDGYRQYEGLTMNWVMFGSSGHRTRPAGGVLKNYHHCFVDEEVKSICRTDRISFQHAPYRFNVHHCHASDEKIHTVDANGNPSPVGFRKIANPARPVDKIALYHYSVKSAEDFMIKKRRGQGAGFPKSRKDWSFFKKMNTMANQTCMEMARRSQELGISAI